MIADNVNDNFCEDNTSNASGNCSNNDDNNNTDESYETYETSDSTTTTRTTATVTTTTTDEVTCELNHIDINECDRDVLEVSEEEIISKFHHGRYF